MEFCFRFWFLLSVAATASFGKESRTHDNDAVTEFATSNPHLLGAIQNIVQSGNDIISDFLTTLVSESRDNFRTTHTLINALDRKISKHQTTTMEVLQNILNRMRQSESEITFGGKLVKPENSNNFNTSSTTEATNAEEEEKVLEEEKIINFSTPQVLTDEEKYYISNTEGFKWAAAQEFCASHNWTLASPKTVDELALIWRLAPHKDGWYWTSASDDGHLPGRFYWMDSTAEVELELWATGQPDGFANEYSSCAALNDEKLFDLDCSYSNYFICQKF
ncbi:uncharacterized protein LOC132200289 [Neocloeon triangulifer]|uniref:uncharacterized protein LOC132200289 n=1 Tax=Neocloeon triangulifer TaxID=2078957 RepID=UPI00286F9F08|nr:uncharacterized protein LOC132200289 [Neocloeon triangulifer]